MKKKNFNTKLVLKKLTVSNLTNTKGGQPAPVETEPYPDTLETCHCPTEFPRVLPCYHTVTCVKCAFATNHATCEITGQ